MRQAAGVCHLKVRWTISNCERSNAGTRAKRDTQTIKMVSRHYHCGKHIPIGLHHVNECVVKYKFAATPFQLRVGTFLIKKNR